MMDVDEDHREQVNDLKLQQVTQPVADHTKILLSRLQAHCTNLCADSRCCESKRGLKTGWEFPAVSLR